MSRAGSPLLRDQRRPQAGEAAADDREVARELARDRGARLGGAVVVQPVRPRHGAGEEVVVTPGFHESTERTPPATCARLRSGEREAGRAPAVIATPLVAPADVEPDAQFVRRGQRAVHPADGSFSRGETGSGIGLVHCALETPDSVGFRSAIGRPLPSWLVSIETHADLEGLRRVGRVVALTLEETRRSVEPGSDHGGARCRGLRRARCPRRPPGAELRLRLPRRICISVGDEVVHGIPSSRQLVRGDVVKLDVTAELGGYMADAAITVLVPPCPALAERLAQTAGPALANGIAATRAGRSVNAIGRAVGRAVDRSGFAACDRPRATVSAARSTSRRPS